MASIDTAERTAQTSTARDANPAMRPLQLQTLKARFAPITITAECDASGDDIVLGKLGCAGVISPEDSTVTSLSGAVDADFVIEKVSTDGTVTAISGAASVSADDTPVSFARKASSGSGLGTDSAFSADDYLQITLTDDTAIVADDVIEVILAYTSENVK